MQGENINWKTWYEFFLRRRDRQLPRLKSSDDRLVVPESVARSLAVFQLGESGGGTVIEQAKHANFAGIDEHYGKAVALFVAEEHRHAEILAICVRNLGGTLIRKNWTAKLFVYARRMIGLRLKVLVLLAAEVVGICYYHLIASRLPPSRLRSLLCQIVNDEHAHLHFHCDFLRSQTKSLWRRLLFTACWRVTMLAAVLVVLIDHRQTLRDLRLPVGTVWKRWKRFSLYAEQRVTRSRHLAGDPDDMPGEQTPAATPDPATEWRLQRQESVPLP